MPLEEGDTFFFQPRPLKNLVLVDEQENLSPIMSCQVSSWVCTEPHIPNGFDQTLNINYEWGRSETGSRRAALSLHAHCLGVNVLHLYFLVSEATAPPARPRDGAFLDDLYLFSTDCWSGQWGHASVVCVLWTRTTVYSESSSTWTGGVYTELSEGEGGGVKGTVENCWELRSWPKMFSTPFLINK